MFMRPLYKEAKDNTQPLCQGWSEDRKDTRVQIGDGFESGYDYIGTLGYIITSLSG